MAQAGVKGIKSGVFGAKQGGTAGFPVPFGMGSPAFLIPEEILNACLWGQNFFSFKGVEEQERNRKTKPEK